VNIDLMAGRRAPINRRMAADTLYAGQLEALLQK